MTDKKITAKHLVSMRSDIIEAKVEQEIVTKEDLKKSQIIRVKWYNESINKLNNC